MDLTDSFTWEDLPTRDADSRQLTAAGWIPLIMKYSRRAFIVLLCCHTVQSTIRIATNHETIFIVWYPFDWTVSPFYELVNISQVTISKTEFCSVSSYSILHLTDWFDWLIFFFLFFFFLSFSPINLLFSFFISLLFPSLVTPINCAITEHWSFGRQTEGV